MAGPITKVPSKWQTVNKIVLASININGVRSKNLELQAFLDTHSSDVVALQETKIDSSVGTQELLPATLGYVTFRNDRTMGGGGTMLLIKKQLQPVAAPFLTNGSESVWAKFTVNGSCYYVASWYKDPDAQSDHINLLREQLNMITAKYQAGRQPCFHVLGDFNYSKIDWFTRLNMESQNCLTQSCGKPLLASA
ncbi:hypothetical protein BSL78_25948 [Apostichopus japonicus]|uniref:Endonuclease/exonuclease/phosphatase domain-containing protein n=1 Tax=Stichopus japonicus TaxID=307972 RepID=A0A2G8JNC2_STIJA|nr:hypothetical protein BSL78_25948 [Apostichopus japonicus]